MLTLLHVLGWTLLALFFGLGSFYALAALGVRGFGAGRD